MEDSLNTSIQQCADKCLTTDLGREGCPWASFAHFCHVNTPAVAGFKSYQCDVTKCRTGWRRLPLAPASQWEWVPPHHGVISLGIRRMAVGRITVAECSVAQPGSALGLSGFHWGSLDSQLQNANTILPKVPAKTSLSCVAPQNLP